ncbi:MAG: agmatine deiminase family protein, partial [Acidobacteriota bacterium]|nr:agmatine deiminase family protein [Acidobacteriota bacterium]
MTVRPGSPSRTQHRKRPISVSPAAPHGNFRMPAEWEPHEATWLGWPHERTDWPGKFAPIPWAFAEIVRHLARVERVLLIVENAAAESEAKKVLRKSDAELAAIRFLRVATDRGWMRDSGPIAVTTGAGERTLLNFAFNGWAKYSDHKKDARVVERAMRLLPGTEKTDLRVLQPRHKGRRVVLEGGSIDVNGRGSLLTTEECLLSSVQERNPGFTRGDYEEIFRRCFGVTNVLWLRNGIAGDDTHGHADDLARFVDPATVVTVVEDDPAEQNYEALQENLALLRGMRDQDGRELRVETLPMPRPVWFDGQRLPASYANFYIANKIVLVPTFNDSADRVALEKLASLFPGREIVPIYCRDLVLGLGT